MVIAVIYGFVFLVYFSLNTCNPISLWYMDELWLIILGLCDCVYCVSLILWSGLFFFFIYIYDFVADYVICEWVSDLDICFTRILKFQRVAHNVFDKLLEWLCHYKTRACLATFFWAAFLKRHKAPFFKNGA